MTKDRKNNKNKSGKFISSSEPHAPIAKAGSHAIRGNRQVVKNKADTVSSSRKPKAAFGTSLGRQSKDFIEKVLVENESLKQRVRDLEDALELKAAVDSGEETFPESVLNDILNGDNPVKVYRKYRSMTQIDLAKATDLSQNYISDIESGRRTGSPETLKAIAVALDVDLDDLV